MPTIQWPTEFEPNNSPIHIKNELDIAAEPSLIYAWLIRAELWPTWYPNSKNITFLKGEPPDLMLGTQIRWTTFGVTIESTVVEFIPEERIAWDAYGSGIKAYHAWLIERTGEGCHVITEETQHGRLARLNKLVMPTRMYRMHQIWLEGLRDNAMSSMPPPTSLRYKSRL